MGLNVDHNFVTEHCLMVTVLDGRPEDEPRASIALATCFPSATLPKTTCRPSNQAVSATVMKN